MKNNVLGTLLLLSGLFMLVLGFANDGVVDEFNIYHMATGSALLMGVLMLLREKGAIAATYIARIFVGGLFFVSGLIKANDTVGFGIKLEEYFDENALGSFWAVFHDFALPIAILVTGIEVVLGLAILFGLRMRLASWLLLLMTIFFGWLTYFTASCNDAQSLAMAAGEGFDMVCVNDCGCFGDAMRGSVGRSLTPWESFYKDLTLLFMALVLVARAKYIGINERISDIIILPGAILIALVFGGWLFNWMFPTWFLLLASGIYLMLKQVTLPSTPREWVIAGAMFIITYGFAVYTLRHLPMKDYRPYAIGKNIGEQMKSAEELGLEPTIYATIYTLKNSETGEEKVVNSIDYLEQGIWKDKSWKIEKTGDDPVVIQRGYEPPITTFNITDEEGTDIGDALISDPEFTFWVVAYDITKASKRNIEDLNSLAQKAEAEGIKFIGLSSSSPERIDEFRHEVQAAYPYYSGDEILLKTIIRSNPGLVLVKNGTIINKWHHNDIPSFEEVKNNHLK